MEVKKKLFEVNIMENKKFVWGLNILAIVLVFPFALLFCKLAFSLLANVDQNLPLTLPELWIATVLFPILIVVHEAIHGLFSRFFVLKILLSLVLNGNRAWPMRPVQVRSTIGCKC